MNTTRPTPSKDEIALLPEFPRLGLDRITLVNTGPQAREAVAAAIKKHPAAFPQIHATSSDKGHGIPELRAEIAGLL